MLSLRGRRMVDSSDLLSSRLYDEKQFYGAFVRDLKQAVNEVTIESPFITYKRTYELLPLFKKLGKYGVRVRVNTRNPNHHDKELRVQAWMSIKELRAVGVKVYTYNDKRHRKLVVIDEDVLWEGSLNILSQSNSRELMRRTESVELCKQILSFTGMRSSFWLT